MHLPWRALAVLALALPAGTGAAAVERVSGADRVGTAVAASRRLHPAGGCDDVVVVNGASTADGVSAAYLAGLHDAPVLFTGATALPSATLREVRRLGASRAWVIGGTSAVGPAVTARLTAAGLAVHRTAGADRYETAALVAALGPAPRRVYVASGERLADALTTGPVAWARHVPVLLTTRDAVPPATAAALADLHPAQVTVLGDAEVVSDATATSLGATDRLAGATRQATAAQVADDAVAHEGLDGGGVALVGGRDTAAADALAAAPLAGSRGVPLLLTDGAALGTAADTSLRSRAGALTGRSWVVGGQGSVPGAVVAQARAAAGGPRAVYRTRASGPATTDVSSSRSYTVTGLDDGASYLLATLPGDAVVVAPDGAVTFADRDGDLAADGLRATRAVVESAGLASAGSTGVRVRPVQGTLTLTLTSATPDTARPVLFEDADGDDRLDLLPASGAQAQGSPAAEAFALGAPTRWR